MPIGVGLDGIGHLRFVVETHADTIERVSGGVAWTRLAVRADPWVLLAEMLVGAAWVTAEADRVAAAIAHDQHRR
jgi:hypothetical protein